LELLVHLIGVLRAGTDITGRSQLIQEHQHLGIAWLCRVLGVDRRRFYRWRRDQDRFEHRAAADDQLAALIARIHEDSGGAYDALRVTIALRREGVVVNRKRVARIMRERGIQGVTRRRRRSLTRPDGKAPPAPDLLRRNFTAPRPGSRLVGDITCVPTREGWVYLAVLLDLCTREIVGRATAARQSAALAITALRCRSRHNSPRQAADRKGTVKHRDVSGGHFTNDWLLNCPSCVVDGPTVLPPGSGATSRPPGGSGGGTKTRTSAAAPGSSGSRPASPALTPAAASPSPSASSATPAASSSAGAAPGRSSAASARLSPVASRAHNPGSWFIAVGGAAIIASAATAVFAARRRRRTDSPPS
jgi:hypothetical protein